MSSSSTRRPLSSFLGNHDDDVIIIDPPAAEMRRALRPLLLGTPKDGTIRPAKRPKQPNQQQTNLTSARRRGRCNAGPTAPKTNALSASATDATVVVANPAETGTEEVSVVLQSVESVTHLFTLATEIRDEIYRHLLVSTKPIHVQNLWTETARRPSRRGAGDDCANTTIDTRILSVCRQTAVEGTRILYSENCFLYLLRDEVSKGRRSQRFADSGRKINLAKYGHLIRHMAIELEPNRTEASGAPVLKALQRINADFLRINVHVNSDIKTGTSSNESGDEADSESDGEVSDTASRRPKKRHLETTIDLRCLPRRMEALSREDPLGNLWANDALMQARRHDQGAKANNTLVNLRLHIEQACLEPEKALRGGVWEDHAAAERRRREKKAKEAARLDGDAWDVKDDRQGLDRWISRGMRSLIISIDRVGGELRAYRP
ncbi:9d98c88d-f8da-423f-a30e-1d115587b2a5 [Thermothielavioides terrestris]|uniref:9d98c88d-f8da-423f-a30e-1d115587b2a5 n=1 Tax=Thermothielavioides terrestris TaxID=2587410 RepID=A0A3S5CWJ7_9PEZI|nr:9d98c88d-f8da-423f-a30e-1d115587b2a5 [Thermothielavioides terrestris]